MSAFRSARRSRDLAYYRQRAEVEIEAANHARHPDAARAHYWLAAYYLDLTHNSPPEPGSGLVTAAR